MAFLDGPAQRRRSNIKGIKHRTGGGGAAPPGLSCGGELKVLGGAWWGVTNAGKYPLAITRQCKGELEVCELSLLITCMKFHACSIVL